MIDMALEKSRSFQQSSSAYFNSDPRLEEKIQQMVKEAVTRQVGSSLERVS